MICPCHNKKAHIEEEKRGGRGSHGKICWKNFSTIEIKDKLTDKKSV